MGAWERHSPEWRGLGIKNANSGPSRKIRGMAQSWRSQGKCGGFASALKLVTERFAGFQGVGDAFLGFLFAAEGDEGFALEVQDVLLADELR